MKMLLLISLVFNFFFWNLSAYSKEPSKAEKSTNKAVKRLSLLEKLQNVERYFPKEYCIWDRSMQRVHPLMYGVFFNFDRAYHYSKEDILPAVKYPIDIHIYSDKELKQKVGLIHFQQNKYAIPKKQQYMIEGVPEEMKYIRLGILGDLDIDGTVTYKGKEVCRYISEGQGANNKKFYEQWLSKRRAMRRTYIATPPYDEINKTCRHRVTTRGHRFGFYNYPAKNNVWISGCDLINYSAPYIEANKVHKDSIEILQQDGSSIFLSKKELKSYIWDDIEESNHSKALKKIGVDNLLKANDFFEKFKVDFKNLKESDFLAKYPAMNCPKYRVDNDNTEEYEVTTKYKKMHQCFNDQRSVIMIRDMVLKDQGPNKSKYRFEYDFGQCEFSLWFNKEGQSIDSLEVYFHYFMSDCIR